VKGAQVDFKPEAQRLKDKVVLVTGGGGTNSIGRSISLRFALEGAKIGVLDIDEKSAVSVAGEITAAGGVAIPITCDITHLEQCHAAAKLLADTYGGRIDVLVNNAAAFRGVLSKQGFRRFNEWSVEDWDYMLDVNLRGMWFCAQAVFPYMQPFGYGKIINMTSTTFWEGVPGFIHYVSSKGGIIGFTRALARELGPEGIRVNAMAPGFTLTEANIEQAAGAQEHWNEVLQGQCLNQRHETADDLAGPAFFLASSDSDFMTGQTILVDGGLRHN
jgi:NAD(P)-dependent dehydrogenase (short-subunit alcohol dehydrogenase family)